MQANLKRRLTLLGVALLVLVVSMWLLSHSSIEVTISGSPNVSATYSFIDQTSGKTTVEIKSSSSRIKKTVRKGSYQVVVQRGNSSFSSFIQTKRFLGKTTVFADLQTEKSRKFAGDNPQACMNLVDNTLISYICDYIYANIKVHLPATASSPTFTLPNPDKTIFGNIEGIVTTAEGTIALVNNHVSENSAHTIYKLSATPNLSSKVVSILGDLNQEKTYSMKPYKTGFLVYDDSLEEIFYYSSASAKPERVAITRPEDTALKPNSLSISENTIVLTFSNSLGGDDIGQGAEQPELAVAIYESPQTNQFTFKGEFADVRACGNKQLCLLKNKTVDIYDISQKKPRKLFSVPGVNSIESAGQDLLAINDLGIFQIDLGKRSGYMQYDFGDYHYCGLQRQADNYLVCVRDEKGDSVALYVDRTTSDTDSIDKKIVELAKLSEIKKISAQGKYIFISPDLGKLVYNDSLQIFDYDPTTKKSVNDAINQKINSLGIDRNIYTIINTAL